MAKVKKSTGAKPARKIKRLSPIEVTLPSKYIDPIDDLNEFSILIHGEKKVGKTTLANQGGRTLFLQHDPTQKAYRRLEVCIPNWRTYLATIKELERATKKKKFPYDRVCIDGADAWFKNCQRYVCKKLIINHPADEGWGRGWDNLRDEFTDGLNRLLALLPFCSVWFLCHSAWKEVDLRGGGKTNKLLPRLSGMAEEILNGMVDGWFAYDYGKKGRRIMILQGDEMTGAGHRISSPEEGHPHFCDQNGEALKEIRMGSSPKEAYASLIAAFKNNYRREKKKGGAKLRKR